MPTVAIDSMGGDHAPDEIIKGVAEASREYDARYILVGDKTKIEQALNRYKPGSGSIEIIHTGESIGMDEHPHSALENKPGASIALAAELVAREKADALLSAGSTGAVILAAAKHIPMIEGVERSALASIFPTRDVKKHSAGFSLILDIGATIHCESKHLVHFAFMGYIYSKYILGIENPRIGLLNVGAEETKGGQTLTHTYRLLKEIPEFNFAGNIEGNNLLSGVADVVVCEGILGNTVIKLMEGVTESLVELGELACRKNLAFKLALALLSPGIKKLKKKMDYTEYGGAPLLGFRRLCIKAHGKSKAKAIRNAIKVAIKSSHDDICEKIHTSVREFNQRLPFGDIVE